MPLLKIEITEIFTLTSDRGCDVNVAWSLDSGTEEKAGKGRRLQKLANELEERLHL